MYAYRRYLHAPYGEREIHVLPQVVDPTRHAIDIGVFEGMYSRRLAELCRGVFGFEANPASAAFCRAALGRSATIHNCALSDAPGTVILRMPALDSSITGSALATIAPSNRLGGGASTQVEVPAARLDDFDLPAVGFVKIDVEGHEEAVLRGAQETLRRDRPTLMVEIEERHNPGAVGRVFEQLQDQDYAVKCLLDGELRDAPPVASLIARQPGEPDYINNFFFIPRQQTN